MHSFIKAMISSKLLRPVFVTLAIVTIVQAILIISITQSSVDSLRDGVQRGLNLSEEEITTQLTKANMQVSTLIDQMSEKTSETLTATLSLNLQKEEMIIEESFEYSLEQSSRTLAIIAAQISPPAIWDNDTPELTRIVQMVHQTNNTVFALFLDKDGKPLTRFLNRKDPIIKKLLASSSVRGSVNKVLESAPKDKELKVIRQPITSNDVEIGTFVLGVSNGQVKSEVQALKDRFNKLITDSNNVVKGTITEESVNVVNTLQTTLKEITLQLAKTIQTSVSAIDSGSKSLSGKLTTLVIITGALLLLVMALLLAKQILKKVNILRRALWDIAEGNGDLTQRANIKGSDEIADMATALNRFIEKTQGIVGDVNSSADNASNMTGTLAQTADRAQEAVNKQQFQVDQISSAISQMSSSIQHVAESIQTSAQKVEEIKTESSEASSISARVNQQLNQLLSDITHANDVVMALETNSNQIGSILDVIRGIADQTNLLALNAAIEAARAGESGRGFAVVADEVRALASKTQESTTEIQKNIESLQQGSRSAVEAISTASQVAQESIAAFSTSDEHLDGVSRSVVQLFDLSTEVASMAEEQTHVAEEINLNVTNISEAAEETADSVSRAAQSSREIDTIVNELKEKVAQFKV